MAQTNEAGQGLPAQTTDCRTSKCKWLGNIFVGLGVLFVGLGVLGMFVYIVVCLEKNKGDSQIVFLPQSKTENTDKEYCISPLQENQRQDCTGVSNILTFPDIGYALMGYNILKGFPQAHGHDPGFTYPIFKTNYSENIYSSDCRYLVPKGLVVLPDISCVTSFSSKLVQTERDFSKSLHESAKISGNVWGVSFSLSQDYQQTVSEVSTGSHVYILSSATCSYYFSKLVKGISHNFDETFIKWAKRLNSSNDEQTYFDFFNTYGTHFPTEVTFGSRYVYQYKMSSEKFQKQTSEGFNIEAAASSAGVFSLGGKLSVNQTRTASEFMEQVETKTITVGAPPPANGDALTWASTVKSNPLPSAYKLESIENLFSDDYMANLDLNVKGIASNILMHNTRYCSSLVTEGEPNICNSSIHGLVVRNSNIETDFVERGLTYTDCVDFCLKDPSCLAINYCDGCIPSDKYYRICFMVDSNSSHIQITNDPLWISVFFTMKFTKTMELNDTIIVDSVRKRAVATENTYSTDCYSECSQDPYCGAYTNYPFCIRFKAEQIVGFKFQKNATSYIMPDRSKSLQ